MHWLACLVLVLQLLPAPGVAATCSADDQLALQWLDKMSRSMREISYQGVVTLQRGQEMMVMQIAHAVGQGRSAETLTELTGQGARITRTGHPLNCIHPGEQRLRRSAQTDSGRCAIADQYAFSVAPGERIAGRRAVRITIAPRDMYRFGYVMALDRETGLLLKAETVGHGQKTLETMQFAQLSYTDPMPATESAEFTHEAQHPAPPSPTLELSLTRAWLVQWLPQGFTATDSSVGTSARRTYTDGLAVFSVFVEELDKAIRPGEGIVRTGGTTAYTRGLRLAQQPVLVTVVGDVPVNTARMVADSVAWVP